jgi:hypothetical protein
MSHNATKLHDARRCDFCGLRFGMYRATQSVWVDEAGLDRDNNACISCLTKLIQRTLLPEDFAMVPVNWWVFRWLWHDTDRLAILDAKHKEHAIQKENRI